GGRSSPMNSYFMRQKLPARIHGSVSEELAAHQPLEHSRELHPPIRGLMILEQGHEDSRRGQRGVVERVRETHLAVAAAVAEVRAARLPIMQGRAAVSLPIFAQ